MLRNPYIAGVERFEAPFSSSGQASESWYRIGQAAHFCLLLWRHFQPELRIVRYTLNCDHLDDSTREFTQPPRFDELVSLDIVDAQQIDIEFISQHPAATGRDLPRHLAQKEDHFPAFLEVFIPLRRTSPPPAPSADQSTADHLVIWCRPNLLPKVTTLWEHAANLLVNQL